MNKHVLFVDSGTHAGLALIWGSTEIALASDLLWKNFPSLSLPVRNIEEIVVELPDMREERNSSSSKKQNDLITTAFRGGVVVGKVLMSSPQAVITPWSPSYWKASVPKAIHHQRIAKALTERELKMLEGLSPNAWDAAGMALFYCGRMGRGKNI
jgi:hypothetical protein